MQVKSDIYFQRYRHTMKHHFYKLISMFVKESLINVLQKTQDMLTSTNNSSFMERFVRNSSENIFAYNH